MPTSTALEKIAKNLSLSSYPGLRRLVKEALVRAQNAIEEIRINSCWEMGNYINEHIKIHGGRAEYGKQTILKLADDLGISRDSLDNCAELAAKFTQHEIAATSRQSPSNPRQSSKNGGKIGLTINHYRALFPIEDDKTRWRLARQAREKGWNVFETRENVRRIKDAGGRKPNAVSGKNLRPTAYRLPPTAFLTPKRGKIGTYQIVLHRGLLAVDKGFTAYEDLVRSKFKEGDFVLRQEDGTLEKISEASTADLFTYPAFASRVVDGDTIWLEAYIFGPEYVYEKLRLRGIDCPELDTSAGQAAKKFVEERIADAQSLVITTTKPDKWDRYLSDVFLLIKPGVSINASPASRSGPYLFLNNLLLEKGHAVRKENYSLSDWGEPGA